MTALPLSHISVLDLTAHRAGPTAVRQLADWGAHVIKIEAPSNEGADATGSCATASTSRTCIATRNDAEPQESRRSCDLHEARGQGRRHRRELPLDVKHRLKVDYDTVAKINPRIVYGSIAGFGQSGPTRRARASTRSPRAWAA